LDVFEEFASMLAFTISYRVAVSSVTLRTRSPQILCNMTGITS